MFGQYVVASLALLATSGISASALRPEGPIDVVGDLDDTLHSVEAALHPLGDAGDLQDGYDAVHNLETAFSQPRVISTSALTSSADSSYKRV